MMSGDAVALPMQYSAHACASTSAAASASVPSAAYSSASTEELKGQLRKALNGIDRGIFGTQVGTVIGHACVLLPAPQMLKWGDSVVYTG